LNTTDFMPVVLKFQPTTRTPPKSRRDQRAGWTRVTRC